MRGALLALALWTGAAGAAQSQTAPGGLIVTYFESPARQATRLLDQATSYAGRVRAAVPGRSSQVFVESERSNRVLVIERRLASDPAKTDCVSASVDVELEAPIDCRANTVLASKLPASLPKGAFHMIMHVDVITPGADSTLKALQEHGQAILNAPGNLGLELGQQTDRANHFAVHEIWASRKDYEAFAASPAAKLLREQLMLFRGALFDDRYYEDKP